MAEFTNSVNRDFAWHSITTCEECNALKRIETTGRNFA